MNPIEKHDTLTTKGDQEEATDKQQLHASAKHLCDLCGSVIEAKKFLFIYKSSSSRRTAIQFS